MRVEQVHMKIKSVEYRTSILGDIESIWSTFEAGLALRNRVD